jgi:hypothetical protein
MACFSNFKRRPLKPQFYFGQPSAGGIKPPARATPGGKMKKFPLALLALAVALAITPAAMASSILFDYSGNGVATNLTFTLGSQVSPGVYNISAVTGTFADSNISLLPTAVNIVPDGAGPATVLSSIDGNGPGWTSPDGSEVYDNLAYVPQNPLVLDSWGGVLFTVGGYEVSIAGENGGYQAWVSVLGNTGDYVDNGTTGEILSNGSVTVTPEPSSLMLLGTGLFALAFVVFRKAKMSGLVLQS